jgi:hypothetical protein
MSIWIVGSFQVKLQEDFAEVFPLVLRFWYGLPASRIVSDRLGYRSLGMIPLKSWRCIDLNWIQKNVEK